MPAIFVVLALILVVILASVLLIPVAIVQRYRAGTARRRVRPWLATVNAAGIGLSLALFLVGAAFTNIWVPEAFVYAASGAAGGMVVGAAGLALTRWDAGRDGLHYTPNRWLVLTLTLAVTGRLLYGLWRAWQSWQAMTGDTSWVVAAGAAGSLAAGAVILGYYFVYWLGVRRRGLRVARRSPLVV